MVKSHLQRWALLCVAATAALLQAGRSQASHTVIVGRGDSIDSLARAHHVSIKDIARANHMSPDSVLVDGRKLIIPDAPKSVVKAPNMRRDARINGDRITVRIGPDTSYRRLALLDNGAEVTVTRAAGEWRQIELPSGHVGWTRAEFLSIGATVALKTPSKHAVLAHVAKSGRTRVVKLARTDGSRRSRHSAKSKAEHARRIVRRSRNDDDDDDRPRRRRIVNHISKRSSSRLASRSQSRHHARRPEAGAPETDAEVVRTAYAYRGVPYHYGGTSRSGFDCSGFTSYVYRTKGVSLPRTAAEQYSRGKRVKSGDLKPGDLVFFHTTRRGVSHVGIYAGKGKFVHASSGGGRVRVDSLNDGYYNRRLVGARRVKNDD